MYLSLGVRHQQDLADRGRGDFRPPAGGTMRPGCAGGQSTERSVCMRVPVCGDNVCVCVCLGMYRGLFRSLLGL